MSRKVDKHECIQALKEAAVRAGGKLTRMKYIQMGMSPSADAIQYLFGGWTTAIKAAGLDEDAKEEKFEFPQADTPELIMQILERHRERKTISLNKYKCIVAIGDVHFPFADENSIKRVYDVIRRYKPDVVVQVGDLMDMLSASKYPRSLNTFTPKAEFELAKSQADKLWSDVREIVPNAQCFQLMGNHDVRPLKRILERWPEGEYFVDTVMRELYRFDGVTTVYDPTEELIIGNTAIIHGYLSGIGRHRDFTQMNVIHGHTHKGGVVFRPLQGKTLWELDCGLVADPDSAALAYRNQKKLHDLTPGIGVVDSDGPRFIPF